MAVDQASVARMAWPPAPRSRCVRACRAALAGGVRAAALYHPLQVLDAVRAPELFRHATPASSSYDNRRRSRYGRRRYGWHGPYTRRRPRAGRAARWLPAVPRTLLGRANPAAALTGSRG